MDLTERVYIVTADDDLPISLQLMCANGTLQPHILPKPSPPCPSSCHHALTVYDAQGNDLAEDIVIDEFEYIVDESGEVFRQIDTKPNRIPSLDCLLFINSADSTKSLTSEAVHEPNMGTSFKTDNSHMSTLSPGSSCTDLHNTQPNCQGCDKTESATASVQVTESLNDVITNYCSSRTLDGAFPVFAVALAAETDQNTVLCEKNSLPVYLNSSTSSSGLQTGNCSVPLSPETLCRAAPESDLAAPESDLAANHDMMAASCVSTCLQNNEKWTIAVTDSTDVDTAVVSYAHNTSLSESVSSSDSVSNSTVQLLQPCMSFSTNFCSMLCSREDSCLCRQSAHESDSNCVSTSCVSAADSNVTSAAGVASSFANSDTEATRALRMPVSQSDTPVTDSASNHISDSSERQLADILYRPADNCDSCVHSISSHSPIAELGSCGMEQHLSEVITAASISGISRSGVLVSAVTTNTFDRSDVSQCCQVETTLDCTDVAPVDAERAERNVSEAEMASGYGISYAPVSRNINCLPHTSDCDVTASDVETVHDCTNVLLVDAERAEQNVSETEMPSFYGISDAPIYSNVDCSPATSNCDVTASDVKTIRDCTKVLPVDAEKAEQNILQTEMPSSCSILDGPNSSNVNCSPPTSDCDVPATDEVMEQKNNSGSPIDKANANDLDARGSSYLSPALDTVQTAATEARPASQRRSDTVSLALQADMRKLSASNYAANYTYNGCQRDLLEAVTDRTSNAHELKQRLRALHRTRRRLRKLRQNKMTVLAGNGDRLDPDILCDSDCKRIRLEGIEQELSGREVLLRRREEDLAWRLLKVEQREQVVHVREELLARCCQSLQSQESPGIMQSTLCPEKTKIMPHSWLQSFRNLKSVDRQSDVINNKCSVMRKRTAHWRIPFLLSKKKRTRRAAKSTKLDKHSRTRSDVTKRKRTVHGAAMTKRKCR